VQLARASYHGKYKEARYSQIRYVQEHPWAHTCGVWYDTGGVVFTIKLDETGVVSGA
jgi:hypothetical protein